MVKSPIRYSGNVTLDPKNYSLSANLTIDLSFNIPSEEFFLIINEKFDIESIDCTNLDSFIVKDACIFPFIEEGNELVVKLLSKSKEISLNIKYKLHASKIGSWGVNKITFNYTELGLYTPWFPYVPNQLVIYNLKILMKNEYQLTGLGDITLNKGKYILKSKSFEKSILLFSAKKVYSQKDFNSNTNLNIFYFDEKHKDFANELSNYSKTIINFYTSLLSPLKMGNAFSIFVANRSKGGSYARNNAVVMQYVDNYEDRKERLFKSLSHEIAHLWWCNAPTDSWEDWLNESFAEYFSLLALREFFSKTSYEQILKERKSSFNTLPPIKNINRTDPLAHEVLYNKGSVLLDDFSSLLGEDNFFKFCNNIHKNNLETTNKVLALVEDSFDSNSKEFLINLLLK